MTINLAQQGQYTKQSTFKTVSEKRSTLPDVIKYQKQYDMNR